MRGLVNGFCAVICSDAGRLCIQATGMSEEFDRSVKAYNRMLRWHEIENAGMTYIDPELREAFLKQAEISQETGAHRHRLPHPLLEVPSGEADRGCGGGI